jgi:hypothetical protein
MTAPDYMPEAFENSLHETGHPHMEPPVNPGRFRSTRPERQRKLPSAMQGIAVEIQLQTSLGPSPSKKQRVPLIETNHLLFDPAFRLKCEVFILSCEVQHGIVAEGESTFISP